MTINKYTRTCISPDFKSIVRYTIVCPCTFRLQTERMNEMNEVIARNESWDTLLNHGMPG